MRGEKPIKDKKYDILHHPNIKKTADGGALPYVHNKSGKFFTDDLSFTVNKDDLSNVEIVDMEVVIKDEENDEPTQSAKALDRIKNVPEVLKETINKIKKIGGK